MEEQFMTVEEWSDPLVRAKFCEMFPGIFNYPDTAQSIGTADIHKSAQDNQLSH